MSATCLALALAAAQPAPCAQAAAWRTVATDFDRARLRDARALWTATLTQAGGSGDPLFDPDRALDMPVPPPGAYRCRFVTFGPGGATPRDWGRCELGADSLVRLDGVQRPTGRIFADTESRAVFLGTLLLGDETRPLRYGRDDRRDLAGLIERVDARRWRLTLPRPGFGSTLELIELVPAQ